MSLARWMLLILVFVAAVPAAAQDRPPRLHLTLRPVASAGHVTRVHVRLRLENPQVAAGQALLRIPVTIVGIPTANYRAADIAARDDAGPLPLSEADETPARPEGAARLFQVGRATSGDVVVDYAAAPRRVTASTNNGPLFDLREEAGGMMGAGVTFLALPVTQTPYRIALRWDLAGLARGSTGIWSLGEGDVETVGPAERLAFTFYAAGPLRRHPNGGDSPFAFYWLAEPPFDIEALAARVERLYAAGSDFFAERDAAYRVFVRQNPYRGQGGTALPQSFMFGYNAAERPTIDALQSLLAHEITHNWPRLEGAHGDTAWYSEGSAEYYSKLLSYRAGLLTTQGFLDEINESAGDYYVHPDLRATNADAARRFWSDPVTQTLPYSRGFMYLAQADAAIRARSRGRRSLDNVVRALRRRQTAGQPYGVAQWLELVGAEIGARRARRDFERMAGGEVIVPHGAFGPCYRLVRRPARRFVLGFATGSLSDGVPVRNLDPASNAVRAGLREGDVIIASSTLREARASETAEMTLTVRRDGGEHRLTYLPRGAPVEAFAWIRNPSAGDDACRF